MDTSSRQNTVVQLMLPVGLDPGTGKGTAAPLVTHLVGVSTNANTPYGSCASCCRMGSANAAVFPLPVCAVPITSRPASMAGMHPLCTCTARELVFQK